MTLDADDRVRATFMLLIIKLYTYRSRQEQYFICII